MASSAHKLQVPVKLPPDHIVSRITGGHTDFVCCSECLGLGDAFTGLVWRQDGSRMMLDCPRALGASTAPPGVIPPELMVVLMRAARIPTGPEAEIERKDLAIRLGDPALKAPPDSGSSRPSVQTLFDVATFDFLTSAVAVAAAITETILALPEDVKAGLGRVRLDRALGCVQSDLDAMRASVLPMAALAGPLDGGEVWPDCAGGTDGAGAGASRAQAAASSSSASSGSASPPVPPAGGAAAARPTRPPPPGSIVVPIAAAIAFLFRLLATALGMMGISAHSTVASKSWASAGTTAFVPGPDGSLVPVGLYWSSMRNAMETDQAIRMPSLLRTPALSMDAALAPIVTAKPMVAFGASASIVSWAPRLGLLLAARRHPQGRALLAATWREWHDALLMAAQAARKEAKAVGITGVKRPLDKEKTDDKDDNG